jgi:glutaredoxin 2
MLDIAMDKKEALSFFSKAMDVQLVVNKDTGKNELTTRTKNTLLELLRLFNNGRDTFGRSRFDAYNALTNFFTHTQGTTVENRFKNNMVHGSSSQVLHNAMNLLVA